MNAESMNIMSDEMINRINEQTRRMSAPIASCGNLMANNIEKLTDFNLKTMRAYADIGLNQMRAMTSVNDAESLQQFTETQAETFSRINSQLMNDAKRLNELSTEFQHELEQSMKEIVETFTQSATTSTKEQEVKKTGTKTPETTAATSK